MARRIGREPLAYVLGEWGFRGLTLAVDARVLVPRPETEIVVEHALARLDGVPKPRVLDVGTGSGAIALAIASERPDASVVATDVSADALAVAADNRGRLGLEGRVELVRGDLAAGQEGPFDLVISNPPYVLPADLGDSTPRCSTTSPASPSSIGARPRESPARRSQLLRPGGWLVLECSDRRGDAVAALLRELGFLDVTVSPDLAGRHALARSDGRRSKLRPRRSARRQARSSSLQSRPAVRAPADLGAPRPRGHAATSRASRASTRARPSALPGPPASCCARAAGSCSSAATAAAHAVAALLRERGFLDVTVSPDLAGRDRVVEGRKP